MIAFCAPPPEGTRVGTIALEVCVGHEARCGGDQAVWVRPPQERIDPPWSQGELWFDVDLSEISPSRQEGYQAVAYTCVNQDGDELARSPLTVSYLPEPGAAGLLCGVLLVSLLAARRAVRRGEV